MAQPHISARVPQALKDKFEEMAREREIPVSALVQEALMSFLQAENFYERMEQLIKFENEKMNAKFNQKITEVGSEIVNNTSTRIIKRFNEAVSG